MNHITISQQFLQNPSAQRSVTTLKYIPSGNSTKAMNFIAPMWSPAQKQSAARFLVAENQKPPTLATALDDTHLQESVYRYRPRTAQQGSRFPSPMVIPNEIKSTQRFHQSGNSPESLLIQNDDDQDVDMHRVASIVQSISKQTGRVEQFDYIYDDEELVKTDESAKENIKIQMQQLLISKQQPTQKQPSISVQLDDESEEYSYTTTQKTVKLKEVHTVLQSQSVNATPCREQMLEEKVFAKRKEQRQVHNSQLQQQQQQQSQQHQQQQQSSAATINGRSSINIPVRSIDTNCSQHTTTTTLQTTHKNMVSHRSQSSGIKLNLDHQNSITQTPSSRCSLSQYNDDTMTQQNQQAKYCNSDSFITSANTFRTLDLSARRKEARERMMANGQGQIDRKKKRSIFGGQSEIPSSASSLKYDSSSSSNRRSRLIDPITPLRVREINTDRTQQTTGQSPLTTEVAEEEPLAKLKQSDLSRRNLVGQKQSKQIETPYANTTTPNHSQFKENLSAAGQGILRPPMRNVLNHTNIPQLQKPANFSIHGILEQKLSMNQSALPQAQRMLFR